MSIDLRPFLYLDLDGTVRHSKSGHEFIQGPDDVAVFPGVVPILGAYKDDGFMIAGITNQGGVAFGFKSPENVIGENEVTIELLQGTMDCIEACLVHEKGTIKDPQFCRHSLLRKPNIGMLAIIELDYGVNGIYPDYDASIFVGDRDEDKLCAERAGIAFQWANDFFGRK